MRISDWSSDVCSSDLLNRLLRQSGRRYIVLVNDFGAVNIDAALIASHDGSTINLANGCVCCTMADGLAEALLRGLDAPVRPEHIAIGRSAGRERGWQYVEISGVAVPLNKKKPN